MKHQTYIKINRTILFVFFVLFIFNLKSQNEIDLYLNKAQHAIDENNYTDAIIHISKALEYKKTITNSHKLANLYISRSACRSKLKNYKEAEADLEIAAKISPEYLRVFDAKNSLYLDSKQYDKILSNSKKALEISPKDSKFLTWLTQAYIEKHDYPNALLFADSILTKSPDDINTLHLKNSILHRQKKYIEAIEISNQIINLKPNDAGSYLNRAINYASLKEYKKAEDDNLFAAKMDTSLAYVAFNNTAFFIKADAKDYKGAIEMYDKSLSLKPDFAYAYSNRGFCKLQLGDINGASKDVQHSLELDSYNSYAYKNLALVRIQQKKISEACSLLKKALDKGYREEYDEEVDNLIKQYCK